MANTDPWESPSEAVANDPWDEPKEETPELPKRKIRSLKEQSSDLVKDVSAAGVAGMDALGMAAGAIPAIPYAAGRILTGQDTPSQALGGINASMQQMMPSQHIKQWGDQTERLGYGAAMKPVEAIGQGLHTAATGYGEIAKAVGGSDKTAEETSAAMEIAMMGGLMKGRGAPKPGTPEYYRDVQSRRGGMSQEQIDKIRETYPEAPKVDPWEEQVMSDLTRNVDVPEGFGPNINDTSINYKPVEKPYNELSEGVPNVDPGLPFERTYKPLDAELTDLSLGESSRGARDKPDIRDFEQIQRDRSNEALHGDVQPLGVDELQRGPNDAMKGPVDAAHQPDAYPGAKPRLKASLPYEYEGGIDLNARLTDRNFKEFETRGLRSVMKQAGEKMRNGEDINPVRTGLEYIQKTSETPYYKEIAKKLLEDEEFKPDFEPASIRQEGAVGRYRSGYHKILIDPTVLGNEQILLHEAIHARTYAPIQAYLAARQGMKGGWKHMSHLEAPVKRLVDMHERLKTDLNDWVIGKAVREGMSPEQPFKNANEILSPQNRARTAYGMTDVHEFVAEGFSNPSFQAQLAQMKLPKELSNKSHLRYYWDAFVHSVAEMMGLKRTQETYLSEILRAGSDLMSGTGKNERIHYAEMMEPNKDLGFGARLKKDGIVDAMKEEAREFRLDKRPIEQVVEDDLKTAKKLEDFTAKDTNLLYQSMMRLGSMVKANLLQDTTLAQIMKNKGGTGPLVRWTVDQMSRIERDGIIKTKEGLDIALKPFRKMYHQKALRTQLMEGVKIWQDNVGVRDLTLADFKNERQWNIYKNFQGVTDTILKEINEKREGAGLKAIERIPSYFHSSWEGDYRVFVRNGAGEKVLAQGFHTEWEAKKAAKVYREKHPDLQVDDPAHVQTDKYGLKDLSAFEDAIRTMSKDDPATRALQATYRELLQKRGFGRTGAHRKGIMGYLGSEEGAMGLRNMERSFDQYVNQAYRYIGNLEKQRVLSDLQKVPLEMRKQMPETFDFLHSYVRKSQGAALDKMAIDTFFSQITKAIGLGERAPARFIKTGADIASMYWLVTPRFLVSQSVQYANAFAKMVQQFGAKDGTKAWFDGIQQTFLPDALTSEGVEWAGKRGYLDATVKNMLSGDPLEYPIGSKMQLAKEFTSKPAAYVEHHLVRLPTFVAFEKALRPYIKDKELRFQEAAEKTDYYMVNYGRSHSPMIYDKLGLAGIAARPLKQYSHNTWGQFIEYAKGVKDKGEIAPMAAFLGVQAAVSGLKGVILVAEATAIITLLNTMFDMDIPTPEQLMLKSGLHDALVFGGLSTALGYDVSSSVSAPSLPQLFSFPGIQFGYRAVKDVGTYLVQLAQGQDTNQDRLKAAMAVSPNAMHEWLREMYTPKGQPVANPNDKDLKGNYRRSETESWISTIFGAKSLPEAKIDAMMRATKQELSRDMQQRMNALDAIVDRAMNGKHIDGKLVEQFIKEGGDPKRMSESITRRIKERMLTGPEREMDTKTIGPSQAHKLEVLKDYLDKQIVPLMDEFKDKGLGFNGTTGEIMPVSETTGMGGKRILNDTEGNPRGGYISRLPNIDKDHADMPKMGHLPLRDAVIQEKYDREHKRDSVNQIKKPKTISM